VAAGIGECTVEGAARFTGDPCSRFGTGGLDCLIDALFQLSESLKGRGRGALLFASTLDQCQRLIE